MNKLALLSIQQPRVIALCAYRDISGMFTTENKVSCSITEDINIRSQSEAETIIQDLRYGLPTTQTLNRLSLVPPADGLLPHSSSNIVDDEEEMLYGDSSSNTGPKEEMNRSSVAGAFVSEGGSSKAEPSHWCLITRESGVMEVQGVTRPFEFWWLLLYQFGFCLSRFTSSLTGD